MSIGFSFSIRMPLISTIGTEQRNPILLNSELDNRWEHFICSAHHTRSPPFEEREERYLPSSSVCYSRMVLRSGEVEWKTGSHHSHSSRDSQCIMHISLYLIWIGKNNEDRVLGWLGRIPSLWRILKGFSHHCRMHIRENSPYLGEWRDRRGWVDMRYLGIWLADEDR